MKSIKQTATYRNWERKLRDKQARAIIAANRDSESPGQPVE
jgi:putative component of toxin-antitoxin plasmid stabilization module